MMGLGWSAEKFSGSGEVETESNSASSVRPRSTFIGREYRWSCTATGGASYCGPALHRSGKDYRRMEDSNYIRFEADGWMFPQGTSPFIKIVIANRRQPCYAVWNPLTKDGKNGLAHVDREERMDRSDRE